MSKQPTFENQQNFALDNALDIEDYSGRNFDSDVIDTIVESSHTVAPEPTQTSDNILDDEHWTNDSFDDLHVEKEY